MVDLLIVCLTSYSWMTALNIYKAFDDSTLRPRMRNLAEPPGESQWIICYIETPSLCLYLSCYVKTWRHPRTGSTWHIALLSEEDRATATGNTYRRFRKYGHAVFEICEQTDKQTHRHTDKRSQYFAPFREQSSNRAYYWSYSQSKIILTSFGSLHFFHKLFKLHQYLNRCFTVF